MEAAIREQFSDDILDEAIARYEIELESVRPLDGFESFVYACQCKNAELILRISHSRHRSADEIAAEIDWVNYLAQNDVTACRAVASLAGEFVEVLNEGEDYFVASLFERARGKPAEQTNWQPPLFERMMGKMHSLSKAYLPGDPNIRRPDWFSDIDGKYIPREQQSIIDRFHAAFQECRELPNSDDSYGLVHLNFHRGNFFVDADQIFLFDFDDCRYSWFADDIAIALFYAVPHDCSQPEDQESAATFLRSFLSGYRQENSIDAKWLARIPLFLKRRELELYDVIHRSMDLHNLDDWTKSFMDRRAWKLENDVPYVYLDFSSF